jgi:hypothetical protein
LSLAIVTPAVAGPFDLGVVVVRAGLYVNPQTAQVTVKSDPLPQILDGIPLDVRSVAVNVSRNQFTLNPTNCDPLAVAAEAFASDGATALPTDRFQATGCGALPFKPHLALSLKGGTKRTGTPALKAVLTTGSGEANIAKAAVALPHSEFLDQAHIGTVCTRVQYAEGGGGGEKCPAGSIYGHATAYSPLLDQPLTGPVYLRSSSNKLPDLVASLGGQIHIDLAGRIDSHKGGIRTTFEVVPDAPVSKFVLEMKGGSKGLLVNSENLCAEPQHAIAHFTAQSGKVDTFNPLLQVKCPRGHGKRHQRAGAHL